MEHGELRIGDLRIEGWSRAGEESWFRIHPPGLGFDVGRGPRALVGAADLFLSHGHLDHAAGLPVLLSQRTLQRLGGARVHCPQSLAEPLAAYVRAAEALEEGKYGFEMSPLSPGDRVAVGKDLWVEAFAVDHVVPTLGFHLIRTKRRLAKQFAGLSGTELAALREQGAEIAETVEELWLSYSSDTGPALFELEPRVFEARVLMLECTFLGSEHRDKGELYKHLHLGDIAERAADFRNEALVLHHLSRRFRAAELRAEAERALAGIAPKIYTWVEGECQ
jgi:ribonuclease Z